MKYTDITNAIDNLDRILRQRDSFIRRAADSLLERLKSADYGFPADEVCLQAIASPIEDSRSYHSVELPTDEADGRRGFRVRFVKTYNGYLRGVVSLAKWVFSVEGDEIVAQISGESECFRAPLDGPPSSAFIDLLAVATARQIHSGMLQMSQDPSVRKTMGFHSLTQS